MTVVQSAFYVCSSCRSQAMSLPVLDGGPGESLLLVVVALAWKVPWMS